MLTMLAVVIEVGYDVVYDVVRSVQRNVSHGVSTISRKRMQLTVVPAINMGEKRKERKRKADRKVEILVVVRRRDGTFLIIRGKASPMWLSKSSRQGRLVSLNHGFPRQAPANKHVSVHAEARRT